MATPRAKSARRKTTAKLATDGRWAEVDEVRFLLARADTTEREWIGQEDVLRQLLA